MNIRDITLGDITTVTYSPRVLLERNPLMIFILDQGSIRSGGGRIATILPAQT
jgi:hypothetical protein